MSIVMGENNYGKSEVRLVKVDRGESHGNRHGLRDITAEVSLSGDFDAAHVKGDNTDLIATDTMRNTVYALAKQHLAKDIESFGLALVDHFLEAGPRNTGVRIKLTEHNWNRIEVDGADHDHSFVKGSGKRTATISGDESGDRSVHAGLDDVTVLKTTNSGWEGYLHEQYTTLPETSDRILSTVITAEWQYNDTNIDFDRAWESVERRILQTLTDHYSPSVQNTLYRMGYAVLEEQEAIERIHFSLPNIHHLLFDLERFGMENDNEIFQATSDPYGLIEGTVERIS